jgi:hypothetical protein
VRILLDESLPRPLRLSLVGHEVSTVRDESWTSLTNGMLLRQAAEHFDAFADRGPAHRVLAESRNPEPIAVVILIADSNRLESLEPLVPDVLEALKTLKPRTLLRVGA